MISSPKTGRLSATKQNKANTQKILKRRKFRRGKYKMGTVAIHQLGDISRKSPDLCVVIEEDAENYYGNWVCGFGFVGVRFPKATTRDLNKKEIKRWNGKFVGIAGSWSYPIKIS